MNIPRVREILVPLTDETIIAMSDYVWEQVWDIFAADSFSILSAVKENICQRLFSSESVEAVLGRRQNFSNKTLQESVEAVLERRQNFSNKTLQQICVVSVTPKGGYLKRKELKEYFERFPNCFCII